MGVQSAFVVDPHVLFLGPNMAMARNLFDSLVGRDAEGHWIPALAVSWKQIDPLTWVFALRHDVRFNDGSPFTAEDVVASVRRIPSLPNNPGPYTSNLRTITGTVAIDPFTVRVTTDRPNPLLPGQFTNVFILSRAMVNAAPEDFSSAQATIGTGPYRLISFRYGDTAVLEPNPYYWGPVPSWRESDDPRDRQRCIAGGGVAVRGSRSDRECAAGGRRAAARAARYIGFRPGG